jgi:hypothetical protein
MTRVAIYAGTGGDIVGVTYSNSGVLMYATKSL